MSWTELRILTSWCPSLSSSGESSSMRSKIRSWSISPKPEDWKKVASDWKNASWPSFESRSKEKDTRTLGSALSVLSSLSRWETSMGLETFKDVAWAQLAINATVGNTRTWSLPRKWNWIQVLRRNLAMKRRSTFCRNSLETLRPSVQR